MSIINNILIIKQDGLGDCLITLPAIEVLHNMYPFASITYIASKRNHEIFAQLPYVSKIILIEDYESDINSLKKIIKDLNFDIAINMLNNNLNLKLLKASRAKIRVGRLTKSRFKHFRKYAGVYTNFSRSYPEVEQLAHEGDLMMGIINSINRTLFLKAYSETDFTKISLYFTKDRVNPINKPFIIFNTNCISARTLDSKNAQDLLVNLCNRYKDTTFVLPINSYDKTQIKEALDLIQNIDNAIIYKCDTLISLIDIVYFSKLCFSPATGVLHLSALFDKPIIGLYGIIDSSYFNPTDFIRWGGYKSTKAKYIAFSEGMPTYNKKSRTKDRYFNTYNKYHKELIFKYFEQILK